MHPVWFVNKALSVLGESPILSTQYDAEDMDSTPTIEKVWTCRSIFEFVLPDLLRQHPWNCVTKRVDLSVDADNPPAFGFTYRYGLPSDFVRLAKVYDAISLEIDNSQYDRYRVEDNETEGLSMHTDESGISIIYVYQPSDVTTGFLDKFDANLKSALILSLKEQFAEAFTGSTELAERARASRYEKVEDAKTVDSQEEGPDQAGSDILITCRW